MTTIKTIINGRNSLIKWCSDLIDFWNEHKYITVAAYAKRTLDQNSGIRVCYSQIRQHNEGWTVKYTERYCKLTYGVPVLMEDPMHEYVFDNVLKDLDYERQLKVMDCFAVTSVMTPQQASDMIDSMKEDHCYIELEKPEARREAT